MDGEQEKAAASAGRMLYWRKREKAISRGEASDGSDDEENENESASACRGSEAAVEEWRRGAGEDWRAASTEGG